MGETKKFLLICSSDTASHKEMEQYFKYIDEHSRFVVTHEDDNFYIFLSGFDDLIALSEVIDQYNFVVSISTKGDELCLEIYDSWREG